MYRFLGMDLETTSLDPAKGRIVESAFVLKDYGQVRPLAVINEYNYEPSYGSNFIPEEAKKIHLITDTIAEQFGIPLVKVMARVAGLCREHKVDFIVAHNGTKFDKPYLQYHTKDMDFLDDFWKIPWIDTRTDINFTTHGTQKLEFLCGQHGFLNPFPHIAFSDVLSMLKLLDMYDVEEVIHNAQTPRITIRAMVSFDDRNKAKAKGYYWEPAKKQWLKNIRVSDFEREAAYGFEIKKVG